RPRAAHIIAGLNGVFAESRRQAALGILASIDVLVANQFEAGWLGATSTLEATCRFLSTSVRRAVVTLGPRGAVVVEGGRTLHLPAAEVKVCRSLGAGDAFLAGLVESVARGSPFSTAY